jgi:tight adherence protein B
MSILLALSLIAVLLGVSAAALFIALMDTRKRRLALDGRVGLIGGLPRARREEPEAAPAPTRLAEIALGVRRVFSLGMKRDWGVRTSVAVLLPLGLVAGAAAWLALAFGLRLPPILALPLAAASFIALPRAVIAREQRQAEQQFTTLFPDAVDMVIRMLRAGLPVPSAIRTVGREAPSPVDSVFATIADQIDIGITLDESLALAGERIGIADFRFFAVAVALQRSTGGNLASTLEILADIVRRRRAARMKAKAATAEVRLSAIILGAMPFLVIGLLSLLRPAYLAPLLSDPRGKGIIGTAIGLMILGFASMRRLMRSVETM